MERPRSQAGPRANIMVDIGDMKVSTSRGDVIVTRSLGSGVGLTLFDPVAGVGGMIHCMLPLSEVDPDKASLKPYMFVDTGVAALLAEMDAAGAQRRNLVAKAAGAGSPLGREETLPIGQRNHAALREVLRANDIHIDREDVGGSKVRALYLYMADGRTTVESEGQETEL